MGLCLYLTINMGNRHSHLLTVVYLVSIFVEWSRNQEALKIISLLNNSAVKSIIRVFSFQIMTYSWGSEFGTFQFQMHSTSELVKVWISKRPVFVCFRCLNFRFSDPHCICKKYTWSCVPNTAKAIVTARNNERPITIEVHSTHLQIKQAMISLEEMAEF